METNNSPANRLFDAKRAAEAQIDAVRRKFAAAAFDFADNCGPDNYVELLRTARDYQDATNRLQRLRDLGVAALPMTSQQVSDGIAAFDDADGEESRP